MKERYLFELFICEVVYDEVNIIHKIFLIFHFLFIGKL